MWYNQNCSLHVSDLSMWKFKIDINTFYLGLKGVRIPNTDYGTHSSKYTGLYDKKIQTGWSNIGKEGLWCYTNISIEMLHTYFNMSSQTLKQTPFYYLLVPKAVMACNKVDEQPSLDILSRLRDKGGLLWPAAWRRLGRSASQIGTGTTSLNSS